MRWMQKWPVDLPHKGTCNAESVSISWRRHGLYRATSYHVPWCRDRCTSKSASGMISIMQGSHEYHVLSRVSNQCLYSPSVANHTTELEYNKRPGIKEHNNCISFGKIYSVMMNLFMHWTSFRTLYISYQRFWDATQVLECRSGTFKNNLWNFKRVCFKTTENYLIDSIMETFVLFNRNIDNSSIIKCPSNRFRQLCYGQHLDANQQRPCILANIDDFHKTA